MGIRDLTQEAVRAAISEFKQIGRDAFLARYGFGKSRGYFIINEGVSLDSKAIAGAAHGFLTGREPLPPQEFSGGDRTVAKYLRSLGFEVATPSTATAPVLPFEHGKVYHRRTDIHEVFGGQERGGITTPKSVPWIFLFTGESGGAYGYSDTWREDGTFSYTGEGQTGDMQFVRGNRAIRDHLADGRDLLLFEALATKGQYRFVGCFACAGWEKREAPDGHGHVRQAVVFNLVPVEDVPTREQDPSGEDSASIARNITLDELRRRAYAAAQAPPIAPKDARRSYHRRSADVKAYVLKSCRHM